MKSAPKSSGQTKRPFVSVVIPSLRGESRNLNRLRKTVLESGIPHGELEILSAIGVSPNGRARDVGTLYASGKYLLFMDEDVSLPDPEDLATLIDFLESNADIGLVGPAQQIPPETPKRIRERALQMPRAHSEAPETFKECDMVTHACLALKRSTFVEVGMEHPNLISGTDPDLRNRVRKKGLKVGIVPDTRVYHPPINSWSQLIRKNFIGGRRSRSVKCNYEQYHLPAEPDIETPDQSEYLDQLGSKVTQHLKRFVRGVLQGHGWWLTAQLSYLLGYGSEILYPTRKVEPIPYPDPPKPSENDWKRFLAALENEGTVKRIHPENAKPLEPQLQANEEQSSNESSLPQ